MAIRGADVQQQIDWLDWLRRWDAQQEGYVPEALAFAPPSSIARWP